MLELVEKKGSPALLKVIGVGGGGSNAVNRMIQAGLADVDFWIANTDVQALERSPQMNRLQIGKTTTRGLGAGGDPDVGRASAEEDIEAIKQVIEGADMVFITAGMGGGTGTGAAPVIARVARELNVLTVAIVTKPFQFEGKKKMARASRGLEALSEHVDTLIAIPNQKLLHIVEPGTSFDDALLMADEVLFQATRGISDLIMGHGIINLDFADVRTVMRNRGNALLGSGVSSGPNRAVEAAQAAVSSPLLEEVSIEGAEALLVNIQGGTSMGFHEAAEAAQFIADRVGEDADVFWGAVVDPDLEDEIRVTLVATGFPSGRTLGRPSAEAQHDDPQSRPGDIWRAQRDAAPRQPETVPRPAATVPTTPGAPGNGSRPTEPVIFADSASDLVDPDVISPPLDPIEAPPSHGRRTELRDAAPAPSDARGTATSSAPGVSNDAPTTPNARRAPTPSTPSTPTAPTTQNVPGAPDAAAGNNGNGRIAAVDPAADDEFGDRRPPADPSSRPVPHSTGHSRPSAGRPAVTRPPQKSEPALPFWRQQAEGLDGKALGLTDDPAPSTRPAPAPRWQNGGENARGEGRRQHRNPLDVPTYLRKPIMD